MLRYYQNDAISAIKTGLEQGIQKQLIVHATGVGKTTLFSSLPSELKNVLPKQMMVILHRDELAEQAIAKLRSINPNLSIGKEMKGSIADPSINDVIVAGVGTLGRKDTNKLLKYNFENFDKFVVDEAHKSVAQSYMNLYEAAGLLQADDKRLLLGVTATPSRGDGEGLNKLYQDIVHTYSLRQAIEDGFLVDVHGIRVTTDVSLDHVATKDGEFNEQQLADTINTPKRNLLVYKAWKEQASDRITIGFAANIKHAKDLALVFKHQGINAEAVWGTDPDRDDKIQRYRDGKIQVLFNAQLLMEGFDLDLISCVILAAPTKSGVTFSQRVGRGTRLCLPWKQNVLVIDVVDSSSRHSLLTVPTLMGMPAGINLNGKGVLWAVKELEKVQAEFPHIDLSKLPDITKLNAYVESVNLFEVKFPQEVEQNSIFTWYNNPSGSGGYIILLPTEGKTKDSMIISQNLLGRFDIGGMIKGKLYRGERDTIEQAFAAADNLIQQTCQESLTLLRQNQSWHEGQATEKQMKLLKKLYKGKQIPNDLTKGSASKLISAAMAGKG